jgi:hypothetical protein
MAAAGKPLEEDDVISYCGFLPQWWGL